MEPIDFSKIVDWAKAKWEEAVSACQADYQDFPPNYNAGTGLPEKKFFDCDFIMDSGTIQGQVSDETDGRDNCELKCIVSHSVGSQDSAANVETYSQTVTMNMRVPERYRTFVTRIWERFATSLKSVLTTIGETSCVVSAEDLPTFGKKSSAIIQKSPTSEGFNVSFDFSVIAFEGPVMANSYSLTIGIYDRRDGTLLKDSGGNDLSGPIQFSQMAYSSRIETRADLVKRPTARSKQSFRSLAIHLKAVSTSSVISGAIVADAEDGAYFGNVYKMTKTGPTGTTEKWLIATQLSIVYSYGSFVALEADFVPAI